MSVAIVSLVFAYNQTREETRSLEQDLQHSSLVLADSLSKSVEPLVTNHSYRELQRLVDRFQDRERIAGIAVYGSGAAPLSVSAGLTPRLDGVPQPVMQALDDGWTHDSFLKLGGTPAHV